ncbi:isoniazid response ATPase/transcriptional regulator IniR [uncultured Mycolicibacterium sp.]|mgnify:CR=1 FL=1|uniref:isoniazid response ATPase/transcriptional regulator IniR n=1 Tax=uncultured Mycolicibacterium sp. TaxID=2320817 RepID=UPI00262EBAED|nr:isoniazid response ATPase/transcriptional regulator IniR [uncultured Mycolicibacterium sp.]
MATTAPQAADLPPAARGFVAAVAEAPHSPVRMLVAGGVGTGKSTVLAGVRTILRDNGIPILAREPRPGDPAEAAVVVDDAHLLDDAALERITDRVDDPGATVVVATEPLTRRPALRRLTAALERQNRPVLLRPLPARELQQAATAELGAPPDPELLRALAESTAGLPFLVAAALSAVAGRGEPPARAARHALLARLHRFGETELDTLLICSLGAELGPDDVAAALGIDAATAGALVDRVRAGGLVDAAHPAAFLRSVHDAAAAVAGAARHREVELAVLTSQLRLGTLGAELALRLAEHGLRDDRLAGALADLAAAAGDRPAQAARLYRAAAGAGATTPGARLADALALSGDCNHAGRLADELLSAEQPAERAAAVRVAAAVCAHDGRTGQAADLYRWLGPYPDALVAAAGTVVTLGAGDAAAARALLAVGDDGPPTSTARAARSLAEGLLAGLDQPYPVVVARLSQAIAADPHPPGVLPDSPAALVTLTALHGGDPVRARSVITRAVRAPADADAAFFAHRHRLLLGWVRMQDGRLSAAAADAAAVAGADLHRRDALWAAALQTAIARRTGDTGALQQHWYTAMEVLAEYSVDLFSLLPLGELWVAAARLRRLDRLAPTVDAAFALLRGLGDPLLWSLPLHWAGVQAGILANTPDAVAPHGQALTAAAAHSPFARALARAGRTWLRVLAGHVDTDEVSASARALAEFGLGWDATRLAGQAALQTGDARVAQAMLQLARDLKQAVGGESEEAPAAAAAPGRPGPHPPAGPLSDREREVAELLVKGLPYREIGSRLFISAKTVEHHVARIRRRLGAESRTEMLSMLRALLGSEQ